MESDAGSLLRYRKKIGAEIDKYFHPEPEPEVQIEPFWLSFLGLFFIPM